MNKRNLTRKLFVVVDFIILGIMATTVELIMDFAIFTSSLNRRLATMIILVIVFVMLVCAFVFCSCCILSGRESEKEAKYRNEDVNDDRL